MSTGPKLLALQHIACEPPGVYEDDLLDWDGELTRIMVDHGERLLAEIAEREDEMTGLDRALFAAWLERVVGAERPAVTSRRGSRASA